MGAEGDEMSLFKSGSGWRAIGVAGAIAGVLALAPDAAAAGLRAAPTVTVEASEVVQDDLYVAGAQVVVEGHVTGDLIVAGGTVTVRGRVDGDVVAVGGTVTLSGAVGQALRAAGSQVRVAGPVGGDLLAAAGELDTESGVTVGGETLVRATDMTLEGDLGRALRARGENMTMAATVHGPARLQAPRLRVNATTRVEGALAVATLTPNAVDPKAVVLGGVASDELESRSAWSAFWPWLLRWFTAVLVGLILLALLPQAAAQVADTAMRHPHWRILAGLGVLFGAPLVAIMAMLTVVALPLGLMLMGLYAAALYLAQLVVAWGMGRWALGRLGDQQTHWKRAVALGLSVMAIYALKAIPVAGLYVNFVIVLWGLGAIAIMAMRGWQRQRAA
jgi:cytoskeletal protein CcmA (bactofilin family)